MLKGAICPIIVITIFSNVLISCKPASNEVIRVNNSSPKYADREFVKLEKLYTIDVTQISLFGKDTSIDMQKLIDFDDDNNLYILDSFESKISVFNEKGEFIKSFGRPGQGPKEFIRPNTLIIKKDKIYVFQGFHEYKILDLDGEYISSQQIHVENRLKLKTVGIGT